MKQGRLGRMTDHEIYSEPSHVRVEDEAVAVKGPDGVDVKLTAEAAEETSDRRLEGALIARGKRLTGRLPNRPK